MKKSIPFSNFELDYSNYTFDYKNYNKKTHPNKFGVSFSVLFLCLILLLGCIVFITPSKENCYYFIKINSYSTFKEANAQANKIQQMGGAGYVYFENVYHVLASFYPTKKQAESVVENIKDEYENASVYKIDINKFYKNKALNESQNNVIKDVVNSTSNFISKFYDLIIELDTDQISHNYFNLEVKHLTDSTTKYIDEFKTQFKLNSSFNKAKKYLNAILADFDAINTSSAGALKYTLIDVVINQSNFLASVN